MENSIKLEKSGIPIEKQLETTAEQVGDTKMQFLPIPARCKLTYTVKRRRYIRSLEGSVIQRLRKEHNVFIELKKTNVYIVGMKSNCEEALNDIKSVIAKRRIQEAERKEFVLRLGQLITLIK